MVIDGKLAEAETGKTFENVNPDTEKVFGRVADASAADRQLAIAAARRASPFQQGAVGSSVAGLRRARPTSRLRDACCC
jgi:acyl-CoA reductase-like NAD-dependent aldehyde dehydrogenase